MSQSLEDIAARFDRDGFAVVEDLVDAETVAALREAYDRVLAGAGAPGDRLLGGLTRQVMGPERLDPAFADNPALHAANAVARRLTGADGARRTFSMLIYKPPGHAHETPWHQDLSYAAMPTAPAGVQIPFNTVVQFWIALDDVDESMGCMEFIPEAHRAALLPHHVASGAPDDEGRLLAIADPAARLDLAQAVKCRLRAGSATVHGYTTPHYTAPNRSPRPRRAYIISFADPSRLARAAAEAGL